MSQRPGSYMLAKDSAMFVFNNMNYLFFQIQIIFPLMLLFSLIDIVCEVYNIEHVAFLTAVASIHLYACLALSWHRFSLSGTQSRHQINPFQVSREDMKFIGLFFLVAILPVLIGVAIGAVVGGASAAMGQMGMGIAIIVAIPVFIYLFIQFIRYSFKLPAKSLGVDLSFADAKRASRGMISRILIAGSLIGMATGVVFIVYSLIAGISVGFASSGEEPGDTAKIIMGFVLGAPILFAIVVVTAINVTILSKAYQWGIQNNEVS